MRHFPTGRGDRKQPGTGPGTHERKAVPTADEVVVCWFEHWRRMRSECPRRVVVVEELELNVHAEESGDTSSRREGVAAG